MLAVKKLFTQILSKKLKANIYPQLMEVQKWVTAKLCKSKLL